MNFSFGVGEREKHQVDFSFDQFSGDLKILVDGSQVVKDFRMISGYLRKAR